MNIKFFIVLILNMHFSINVFAQDVPNSANYLNNTASKAQDDSTFFKMDSLRLSVFAGNNDPTDEPQFSNIHNKYAFGFGFGGDFNRLPHFGLDFDLIEVNRDYETPIGPLLWGVLDQDTQVKTNAGLIGIRAFIPKSGPLRAYAVAGAGYFRTQMIVYGTLFGFPGKHEEDDTSFNFYHGAGIRYHFGRWGLSADYRHFNLKGSFPGFNINNANIGSDVYLLGWYYRY